jgi:hypothetical protein
MVDINVRFQKKKHKQNCKGTNPASGLSTTNCALIEVTPVLRLVPLPVCLKSWSGRSDPCNN